MRPTSSIGIILLNRYDVADYYMTYLGEALLSIYEDNIPLMGTFAWCKKGYQHSGMYR